MRLAPVERHNVPGQSAEAHPGEMNASASNWLRHPAIPMALRRVDVDSAVPSAGQPRARNGPRLLKKARTGFLQKAIQPICAQVSGERGVGERFQLAAPAPAPQVAGSPVKL